MLNTKADDLEFLYFKEFNVENYNSRATDVSVIF